MSSAKLKHKNLEIVRKLKIQEEDTMQHEDKNKNLDMVSKIKVQEKALSEVKLNVKILPL